MAKFNTAERMSKLENESIGETVVDHKDFTYNHEGGIAYKTDKYTELYTLVSTCLMNEPKFYGKMGDTEKRILILIKDIAKENPEFLLKLAVYARRVLYLRSIPIVLLAECSLLQGTKQYVRRYTPDIIRRADELKETVAYLIGKIGHIGNHGGKKGSLPASIKRGLADTFNNFNEYQFQKYNSRDDPVKLRDVLRLVHPKPSTEEQSALFKRINSNTLETPETWETIMSKEGSNKASWEHAAEIMPIFALIRNLRNLLENRISNWDVVQKKLTDETIIRNSKLFPYRFLAAYIELQKLHNPQTRYVQEWLEQAIDLSIINIPRLHGRTAGFSDDSGSMEMSTSEKSVMSNFQIAALNLAILDKISDWSVLGIYADYYQEKNFTLRSGILSNAATIRCGEVGGHTNAWMAIKSLVDDKIKVDRIFNFSDMQCYDTSGVPNTYAQESMYKWLLKYKRNVNPDVYVYSFDLAGHGTVQFPQDEERTITFGGFSDKVFQLISIFEEDKKTAIDAINNISPKGKRAWKQYKEDKNISTVISGDPAIDE